MPPLAKNTSRVVGGDPTSSGLTALTVEFVAKPQEAERAKTIIPATIARALEDVTGFVGYLVMVSEEEPRLVTVVTLWTGDDRSKPGREKARWVCNLVAPYLDRCLRVQNLHCSSDQVSRISAGARTGGGAFHEPADPEEYDNLSGLVSGRATQIIRISKANGEGI